MGYIIRMLGWLGMVVPSWQMVLVMADRGLWSPALWAAILRNGWHPVLRLKGDSYFQPYKRVRAIDLLV